MARKKVRVGGNSKLRANKKRYPRLENDEIAERIKAEFARAQDLRMKAKESLKVDIQAERVSIYNAAQK